MSFLVDPPLLVAGGAAASRLVRDERSRTRVERAVLAVFLGTSISLYLNARWTRWLWRLCGAESGRDWMLNSGVAHFEHRAPRPAVHAAAAVLFATYPSWYRLGGRLGGRRGRGPGPHRRGVAQTSS
ncbi:MAG: hypothetical protein ACYDAD_13865 [Acidimicrobiales bacterium]